MQKVPKMLESKAEKGRTEEREKVNACMCVGESVQLDVVLKGTPALRLDFHVLDELESKVKLRRCSDQNNKKLWRVRLCTSDSSCRKQRVKKRARSSFSSPEATAHSSLSYSNSIRTGQSLQTGAAAFSPILVPTRRNAKGRG